MNSNNSYRKSKLKLIRLCEGREISADYKNTYSIEAMGWEKVKAHIKMPDNDEFIRLMYDLQRNGYLFIDYRNCLMMSTRSYNRYLKNRAKNENMKNKSLGWKSFWQRNEKKIKFICISIFSIYVAVSTTVLADYIISYLKSNP